MKNIVNYIGLTSFISALVFIPIFVYYLSLQQKEDRVKQQVLAMSTIKLPSATSPKVSQIEEVVGKSFPEDEINYSVVVKNLKTGEEYRFNSDRKYNSASLYKLWVMGEAFQEIKDGKIDESQVLVASQQKLDDVLSTTPDPKTEGAEATPTPEPIKVSMTTKEAIEKMIKISDNYAALLVAAKEGRTAVANFQKKYDFTSSNFKSPPQTTADDIALFYELLYNGGIVDKENSVKMMEILKLQQINDRIPKYLPKDVVVAHKTGELLGAKHDAGIVFTPKGDYIIVVMSDTNDPKIAAEKTALLSKDIYDYFEKTN